MIRRRVLRVTVAFVATVVAARARRSAAATTGAATRLRAPQAPWEAVEFVYTTDRTDYPGYVVRVPDGSAAGSSMYAVCRICPHQGCIFGYETDYRRVGDIAGVDLVNPVFFCRCHLSVYDPAQHGRVVAGPAPRPPWNVSIHVDGDTISVTGIEAGTGKIGA